jgi:integration host factor subunit beta
MTKADLISIVAEKLKFPWARAEHVVDQIFHAMIEALKRGEGIEIRGFGSFSIREYRAYEGRNPRTGETVHVKPKRLAFFKVGKQLRERVNNGRDGNGVTSAGGNRNGNGSGGTGGAAPGSSAGTGTNPATDADGSNSIA